ncbi:hypothetical protein [Corallococcus sp. AB038B]|uniref:hypothetical protein n=1 Tax=Corallococcus sp. AB038B TaxID=2316718 RepID=UPI001F44FAB7|nr:hypothetical protein [Corallococcus sp. AB038B]
MRADALVLALVLVATGCASVSQAPVRGRSLSHAPREASSPVRVETPSDEAPRARDFLPRGFSGSEQRLLRRQHPRDDVTAVGDVSREGAVGGEARSAALARQAVLEATEEVKGSLSRVEAGFSKLADRPPPLVGWSLNGVFTRYLDQGSKQVTWLHGALGSATALTEAAPEVGDTGMELGLLRMTGPKLQAAQASGSSGAASRATWTSTTFASGWSRPTTRRFTEGETGSWGAHGPVSGTG